MKQYLDTTKHSKQIIRGITMHTINQLTTAISQNAHKQTSTQTNSMQSLQNDSQTNSQHQTAITKQEIASLFNGWKRLFRSKMKDEDWDTDTVIVWHIALNDLVITPDEFMTAKRKSLALQWPPTAPADFLELGRKAVMDNYPDVRQAYVDQANFKTDCPIAYETARRVGFSAMREQPEHITYPVWQKHYQAVCIEHRDGAEFKKVQVLRIDNAKPQAAVESQVSDKYLNEIRAILAGDKNVNQ